MGSNTQPTFEYEALTGFFMQDEAATDPSSFDYRKTNFGLIARLYPTDDPEDVAIPQWHRFMRYLNHLIQTSPDGVFYKLIYLGRHGEGYHNVAEAYYGTAAWDDYWSKLDGNGSISWSDAHLTDTGQEQAREASIFFGQQFAWAKMPEPERYYSSPLWRCLQTADLTFSGLKLPEDRPFLPVVKEMLREVMGVHTCDRRSSRTAIHERWRTWEIEEGFSEEDELWVPDRRETRGEHDVREKKLLDDVFANDRSRVVSMTAHSGTIASLLRIVGHREFKLKTGGLIPVLIKAIRRI
ncbi:hypothetical protein M433DRAFT_59692 [Acidomyces richmondensis BFW]|nr:MAG: hypothetical protein FE78DRAFT_152867 [Acidomyces sp. 'richmondensis']KYG49142.1 hypothetical protein M433DRAFT_59692 [Acidomyces richmondensis BFW]